MNFMKLSRIKMIQFLIVSMLVLSFIDPVCFNSNEEKLAVNSDVSALAISREDGFGFVEERIVKKSKSKKRKIEDNKGDNYNKLPNDVKTVIAEFSRWEELRNYLQADSELYKILKFLRILDYSDSNLEEILNELEDMGNSFEDSIFSDPDFFELNKDLSAKCWKITRFKIKEKLDIQIDEIKKKMTTTEDIDSMDTGGDFDIAKVKNFLDKEKPYKKIMKLEALRDFDDNLIRLTNMIKEEGNLIKYIEDQRFPLLYLLERRGLLSRAFDITDMSIKLPDEIFKKIIRLNIGNRKFLDFLIWLESSTVNAQLIIAKALNAGIGFNEKDIFKLIAILDQKVLGFKSLKNQTRDAEINKALKELKEIEGFKIAWQNCQGLEDLGRLVEVNKGKSCLNVIWSASKNPPVLLEHKNTLLMSAVSKFTRCVQAEKGQALELIKKLILSGANLNTKNQDGETALILFGKKSGRGRGVGNYGYDLIWLLKDNGARFTEKDKEGFTVLMYVVRKRKLFNILASAIDSLNYPLRDKIELMFILSFRDKIKLEELIKEGLLNIEEKDEQGRSVRSLLENYSNSEDARRLFHQRIFYLEKFGLKNKRRFMNRDNQELILSVFRKAYFWRGIRNKKIGNYKKAIEDFHRLVEMFSDNSDNCAKVYEHYIECYYMMGDYKKALELCNKAISLFSEKMIFFRRRGYIFINLAEYKKAEKDFEKVIKEEPLPYVYAGLGKVYYRLGMFAESIKFYDKEIELDPNTFGLYKDRGLVYCKAGDLKKAIIDFEKALTLMPSEDVKQLLCLVQEKLRSAQEKQEADATYFCLPVFSKFFTQKFIEKELSENIKKKIKDFNEKSNEILKKIINIYVDDNLNKSDNLDKLKELKKEKPNLKLDVNCKLLEENKKIEIKLNEHGMKCFGEKAIDFFSENALRQIILKHIGVKPGIKDPEIKKLMLNEKWEELKQKIKNDKSGNKLELETIVWTSRDLFREDRDEVVSAVIEGMGEYLLKIELGKAADQELIENIKKLKSFLEAMLRNKNLVKEIKPKSGSYLDAFVEGLDKQGIDKIDIVNQDFVSALRIAA